MLLQDILQKDNLRDKFRFTAMLYNYSCIGEDYILDEGIYRKEDLKVTEETILTARFAAGAAARDFISETDASYIFASFDGHCKVKLLKSCPFLFEVEFSRMIPSKEPVLVKKSRRPEGNILDSFNFRTSDIYEPNSVISKSLRGAYTKDKEDYKIGNQYFAQKQKFHFGDFPIKYSYPLFVLLDHRFNVENSPVIRDIIKDLFCTNFLELMDSLATTSELSTEEEKFLRNNYSISYLKGYLLVQLNRFKDAEAQLETKPVDRHPRVAGLLQKSTLSSARHSQRGGNPTPASGTMQSKESNVGPLLDWGEDSRNPTSDIIKIDNYTRYLMVPAYEGFFSATSGLIYSISSGGFLVTSPESPDILRFEHPIGEERLINLTLPQKVIRIVHRGEILEEIEIGRITDICGRILKANRVNAFLWQNAASKRVKAIQRFKSGGSSSGVQTNGGKTNGGFTTNTDDPEAAFTLVKCCSTPRAVCEAYQNKTVKLKFIDRTILTLDLNKPRVFQIISKFGEILELGRNKPAAFGEYLQEAEDFADFVFTDPQEKEARESAKKHHEGLVQEALRSNQALKQLLKPYSKGPAPEEEVPRIDRLIKPMMSVTSHSSELLDHSRDLGSIDVVNNQNHSECEFLSANWRVPVSQQTHGRHEFTPKK